MSEARSTMRMVRVLFLAAAQVCLVGVVGCDSPATSDAYVETTTFALWVPSGAHLWPHDNGAGVVSIRTCFTSGQFTAAQQTAIRRTVEDNWERAAFLDFWDWGTCPTFPPSNALVLGVDSRIALFDQTVLARSSATGRQTAGANSIKFVRGDVAFNAHVVLHEFGHTLGFADETNATCTQRTNGGSSPESPAEAALSVMSVGCPFSATILSAWDTMGARAAYGSKPQGTIAGLGGLALDVSGASLNPGAPIIGWPATGSDNDMWTPFASLLVSEMVTTDGSYRCLAVQGGALAPSGSTPLDSESCAFADSQRFHFVNVLWRAMGTMCIVAEGSGVGAGLSIAECDAGVSGQHWDFFADGTVIRLSGTNNCLAAQNGSTTLGTRAVLAPCGQPNQGFQFVDGTIIFPTTVTRCLAVAGGTTSVGNQIVLWDGCGAGPSNFNETFTIFGQITAFGQCVNMLGGIPFDGVPIGMYPCGGGQPNEMWEYFF